MEERRHWNDEIPGTWSGVYRLDQVGSYVSHHLESRRGVYRLIGLAEAGNSKPATIDRICGRDETGTLYVGCEGKNFAVRSRLSKLVRSLREPRRGSAFNSEHNAGLFLRRNWLLSSRFPPSKLAIAWCYDPNPYQDWIYPETMSSIPPR